MFTTKYFKPLTVLAFAILVTQAFLAPHLLAATTYVSDTFARTNSDSWGNANVGGSYTLSGSAQDFDVSQVGMMKLGVNVTRSAYLNDVSAQDVDFKFRIKRDKTVQDGVHIGYFIGRQVSDGTSYLARIRYAKGGAINLQASSQVGGTATLIGGEVGVPNVTNAANTYIWVRGQITGANPTTIRLKAWAQGQSEPGWQYSVTDSTPELQGPGAVGLRAYLGTGATNAPVIFYFDDFNVTDAGGGTSPTATPVPPTKTPTQVPPTATSTSVPPTPTRTPVPPTPTSPPSTGAKVYWGAMVNGLAPTSGNLAAGGPFDLFEQRAKKKMAILHWGQPWQMNNTYQYFQTTYMSAVRSRGSIPLLDWSSWNLGSGVIQPNFQSADIYNGSHDAFIRQWAQGAAAWGHPFFLRFDWEMNGNWQYSWSEQLNGNLPGDYIKMWRHVHDIFEQEGATNVTWVWCPNISGGSTATMASVYPGDAYVDWTCLDGYNKYNVWLNFNQVINGVGITWLGHSYTEITTLAPSKPLMLGEYGSLEAGDGGAKKAAWHRDALKVQIPTYFPKIKAHVYFNWDDRNPAMTVPIETSQQSIDGFADGISSGIYPANVYGNLNTSPIPPLP